MTGVAILRESHTADDLVALDRHWQAQSTFVYAPEKASAAFLEQATALIPADLREHHFALLTSGSTGRPKLIIGAKSRAEALTRVLHEAQASDPVLETIVALPSSYSYAFVNQWLWSCIANRRLVWTDGFRRPNTLLEALRAATDAMLCLVGSQIPLFQTLAGDAVYEGVIRLHFAGGRFPQEELPRLRQRFPRAHIYNNYGCAEAMPRLTIRKAEDAELASDVGRPIEGVVLQSDPDGALRFRSAYGAVAFIEGDQLERIGPEDWVPTGDLGHQADNGHWILDGRSGDVFKRHGEKVSAASLIAAVKTDWSGLAVTYRESDRLGEAGLVLLLCPQPDAAALDGILRTLRRSLLRPHWPLRIEALATMPLLANGKPDLVAVAHASDRIILWQQRI